MKRLSAFSICFTLALSCSLLLSGCGKQAALSTATDSAPTATTAVSAVESVSATPVTGAQPGTAAPSESASSGAVSSAAAAGSDTITVVEIHGNAESGAASSAAEAVATPQTSDSLLIPLLGLVAVVLLLAGGRLARRKL